MGRQKKKQGAVGFPPEIDYRTPIRVGGVYEIPLFAQSQTTTGIELFNPSSPGWYDMGHDGIPIGAIIPGDTFIAVERVDDAVDTDEVWIVLCRGILGKCMLGEWEMTCIVREVSRGVQE